jgi:hypothetical protein
MPLSGKHLVHAREISRAGDNQLAVGGAGMVASGKCREFCRPGDAIQVSTITFPANINQEKHKANGRQPPTATDCFFICFSTRQH